jgi:hypothetical protein
MPSNRVRIIVRCEDRQQRCFIYRYLDSKGFHMREVEIENSPKGKGSGAKWVLDEFPREVKALRSGPSASKGLISIIDADVGSVADHKQQHDDALIADKQVQRGSGEKIAVVVPRRNIETWIHHLLGMPGVNETDAYPKFSGEERKCAPAAENFARRCPNNMQIGDIPSLHDGCAELQRIG